MKIGTMLKWNWFNTRREILNFYISMFVIMIVLSILFVSLTAFNTAEFQGEVIEIGSMNIRFHGFGASTIFLFVMGIIGFHQNTRIGISHGVSRRSIYLSTILYCAILALGMGIVDVSLMYALTKIVALFSKEIIIGQALDLFPIQGPSVPEFFLSLFDYCAVLIISYALGTLIGAAYYRMNKVQKVFYSITVPAVLFIGLPLLTEGSRAPLKPLAEWLTAHVQFFWGYPLALVLLFGAIWLFIRRAPANTVGISS